MDRGTYKPLIKSIITASVILAGTEGAYAKPYFPELDKTVRLKQARELLGSHYSKSIVKSAERYQRIQSFIFAEVKDELKDPWKPQARRLAKAIMEESKKYSFDPIFLMAVISHESVFDPQTKGKYGEIGLMQIKPKTAKWIAQKYKINYHGDKTLYDPVVNVKFGAAYLDYLRERFAAQSRLYLAAYNMGVTNVHRALGHDMWPSEYSLKVMQQYVRLYGELVRSRVPEKLAIIATKDVPTL